MPNLPRIRRTRSGSGAARPALAERRPARALRTRADLAPPRPSRPRQREPARRALRLARARRRGRALEAAAAEDRRVPGVPVLRPPLPRLRQGDPAPERGRARRLPRAGLPRHAAERPAAARHAPLPPLRGGRAAARGALREGIRPRPLRGARRPLRLLLPDPRQDRAQARLGRGRHVRAARRGRRPRPLEREAGDHLLPQDHQAGARRRCACSSAGSSGSCPRSSTSTSTTSSTAPSGSGTSWTTTRRSSKGSSRRTSR